MDLILFETPFGPMGLADEVGKGGLTGYAGGLELKRKLLELERRD